MHKRSTKRSYQKLNLQLHEYNDNDSARIRQRSTACSSLMQIKPIGEES
jgi:hypothetical protein